MKTAIRLLSPVLDGLTSWFVHSLSNHPAHALLTGEKPPIVGIDEHTREA